MRRSFSPATSGPPRRGRTSSGACRAGLARDFCPRARGAGARGGACDFLLSLERVEACDAYRAGDGVHAAWLQRRARVEPFFTPLFRQLQPKHRALLRLERAMFAEGGARQVICNSRLVREEIVGALRLPGRANRASSTMACRPPRASKPRPLWRAEMRRELGLAETDYVLLFAGSGWERKGLRWAIEAVNAASGRLPLLLVAGKGDPARMPRSGRVRYLGPGDGVARGWPRPTPFCCRRSTIPFQMPAWRPSPPACR